jgi:threonine dehydrogenase-like Zn-dependent dehydrogenase
VLAVEYLKSVPRYLASRYLGPRVPGLYTSPFGTIRLADLEPPRLPGETWVRVRPLLAGICGSDLATLTAQGSPYFSPFTSCPFVLGHEVVGEVTEIGPAAEGLRAGDRVVLQPALHCAIRGVAEICAACRAGLTSHCLRPTQGTIAAGIQTGFCRDTGGAWSHGFVAEARQLHRVPADLPDDLAVLVEPLSCCLHAALAAPLEDARTVLVLGGGTIGLLTIAAARAAGYSGRLVAVAKHPHQQKLARALGADPVLGTGDLWQRLAEVLDVEIHRPELGGPVVLGGADVCFECVGTERSLADALRFTRYKGSVIVVGMPAVPRAVDWTGIWHKELVVRGAYTSTTPTFHRAIEVVAGLREQLSGFVGARFPLARYKQAIACALHAGREGVVKTVFEPFPR